MTFAMDIWTEKNYEPFQIFFGPSLNHFKMLDVDKLLKMELGDI